MHRAQPSGYSGEAPPRGLALPGSNGLLLDARGRLVLFQHGNRSVARLERPGAPLETLATGYNGRRFNSPNDGAIRVADGAIYFTDPPFGLSEHGRDGFPNQELGAERSAVGSGMGRLIDV